jgi:predicted CxxxxCH...CXXCH cytochrome family protein
MRGFAVRGWLGSLAMSVMLAGPVQAAQRCAVPSEQAMFDLEALKSELMVLAVACHSDTPAAARASKTATLPPWPMSSSIPA